MKRNKKLTLDRKAVRALSKDEVKKINGGGEIGTKGELEPHEC